MTSLHQKDIESIRETNPKYKKTDSPLKVCIVKTPLQVKVNKDTQVKIGHGEGETKWKGWAWKFIRIRLDTCKVRS